MRFLNVINILDIIMFCKKINIKNILMIDKKLVMFYLLKCIKMYLKFDK